VSIDLPIYRVYIVCGFVLRCDFGTEAQMGSEYLLLFNFASNNEGFKYALLLAL